MGWIYNKHTYLNKDILRCISSIYEFDMKMAGPSILYSLGYLSVVSYNKIINHPDRKVFFGKILQKYPDLNNILGEGFIYYMNKFMELNNYKKGD
jgi:hypothetical protein